MAQTKKKGNFLFGNAGTTKLVAQSADLLYDFFVSSKPHYSKKENLVE